MELRVLRYFLAVAREESISDAADFLHITQPTLSRQLMDLEEELGKQLLIRGKRNRKIALTEDGMRLRKRAEEIIALADKTEAEFLAEGQDISGDVYIGCGESDAMRIIARTAVRLKEDYPDIRFHLYSGNAEDVSERMEKGLLDFGIFITAGDIDKYDYFVINDEIADCAARINDIVTDNNPELIGSDCVNKIKNDILKFSKGE